MIHPEGQGVATLKTYLFTSIFFSFFNIGPHAWGLFFIQFIIYFFTHNGSFYSLYDE